MIEVTGFQPIVAGFNRVGYHEYPPIRPLQPYIACFWESDKTDTSGLVVPDMCADILFMLNADGAIASVAFAGPSDAAFESEGDGTQIFAVRFYAWALHQFVPEALVVTVNQLVDPVDLFPGFTRQLLEALGEARANRARMVRLEAFFLKQLEHPARKTSTDFFLAMDHVLNGRSDHSEQGMLAETLLSRRQLERIFKSYLGLAPRQAEKLIRFQRAVRELSSDPYRSGAEIAVELGFHDQAHFIKQFKRYSNHTPTEFQRRFFP
ncbi:AraC family transcriptional regulator [Listeria ilorinensis]|uniref:AraC family transcriptional regulator n=1 Tax=Listeria ilorinensis TaxID=2867439 RepID=UPI001EF452A5|nr:helix-turn-helix domain-containing protein [Listeria ilorinensis]